MPHDFALTDEELCRFLDLGYHIVHSSDLAEETHDKLFDAAVSSYGQKEKLADSLASLDAIADNLHVRVPLLNELLTNKVLDGALTSVLGPRYFRYGHSFIHLSGTFDQTYHKDSPLPWGTRGGLRSHRPNWAMVFYYPQAVTLDLGATELLPGTQYWNVDREGTGRKEGEDRLGGHDGQEDINAMNSAERNRYLQSQLADFDRHIEPMQLTLPKGSLVMVHFDLFHRGMRRLSDEPRFMYKFWYVRTTEPNSTTNPRSIQFQASDVRRQQLVTKNARWLGLSVTLPLIRAHVDGDQEADQLARAHNQVDQANLVSACIAGTEAARRSAMYALVGCDHASIHVAAQLVSSDKESERCCAAFLLGELDTPRAVDLNTLLDLAINDTSTDVKMTATNGLGRVIRRRIAQGDPTMPVAMISRLALALVHARERYMGVGLTLSAERQCVYIALLNIVSSIATYLPTADIPELAEISTLLTTRVKEEIDRYAKCTAVETLVRLASFADT